MAWISSLELKDLKVEVSVLQRLLRESEKQTAYAEARLDSQEVQVEQLQKELEFARGEKKELLEELLIASGVKMSKYQEALAKKQLEQEDLTPNFTGQTRSWAHQMERESIMTPEQKNRRAIELVEELERETGLNTGGLANV